MSQTSPPKPPPAYLFALGHHPLPDTVQADGATYRFTHLFKHDFFAATALYQLEGSKGQGVQGSSDASLSPPQPLAPSTPPPFAVLKIQRTYPLFGLPLRWLGRRIACHEIAIYRQLQGIPGIPRFLGTYGPTGFLHEFIPGTPLDPTLLLTPQFFVDLHALLSAIHAQKIAYVDTNKRENILFGHDGKPWLIDFQISWQRWSWVPECFLTRWALARLQRADWYHFYKHKTRLLPQHCSPDDFAHAADRGLLHTLHRLLAQPLIHLRRRFLSRYHLEKVK